MKLEWLLDLEQDVAVVTWGPVLQVIGQYDGALVGMGDSPQLLEELDGDVGLRRDATVLWASEPEDVVHVVSPLEVLGSRVVEAAAHRRGDSLPAAIEDAADVGPREDGERLQSLLERVPDLARSRVSWRIAHSVGHVLHHAVAGVVEEDQALLMASPVLDDLGLQAADDLAERGKVAVLVVADLGQVGA